MHCPMLGESIRISTNSFAGSVWPARLARIFIALKENCVWKGSKELRLASRSYCSERQCCATPSKSWGLPCTAATTPRSSRTKGIPIFR